MIVKSDGFERPGFALKDVHTGEINLVSVCDSQREADSLLDMQRVHQTHKGRHVVVPVLVTLTEAKA